MNSHNPHQAYYAEDGSIIIPQLDTPVIQEQATESEWLLVEEELLPPEPEHDVQRTNVAHVLVHARQQLVETTSGLMLETRRQYAASAEEAHEALQESLHGVRGGMKSLWIFLNQPVWIVKKNKKPKQYSRMSLFLIDSVRFGGTFAAIFVALFFSLNYQSFWQILSPHLDPLGETRALTALANDVDNALTEKLMKSPTLAVAGATEGNLLSYLPLVGPPENRIIIPKMNLNVPLVTPSYQSLLQEDWTNVEKDIQDALQNGVVHYPGTARPGQAGNFFVTGHSSYYPWAPGKYKTVFARLHELDVGDEYWVYYGGDKHRYVVESKKEVKPSDVTVLDQPVDRRISTMMTCTPVGTTLRRLIVTSVEVDHITGEPLQVGEQDSRALPKMQLEALPI